MTELETVAVDVVHPLTGEALAVRDASTDQLARFLADCREYESMLREAKAIVSREAIRRMDLDSQWTLTAPGYVLSSQSPAPVEEFDAVALRADLWDLVDAGTISEDAAGRAVETVVDYKVRKAGVTALRKLGGVVKETIDAHATETERKRYVKVERSS